MIGLLPVQVPDWQVSTWVQAFPSLQAIPFAAVGFEQMPVDWLQVPATWHWSCAVQTMGVPALQFPAPSQVSAPLQGLPSLHDVPEDAGACVQTPFVPQVSTVQGLPSSQDCAVHVPFGKPSW